MIHSNHSGSHIFYTNSNSRKSSHDIFPPRIVCWTLSRCRHKTRLHRPIGQSTKEKVKSALSTRQNRQVTIVSVHTPYCSRVIEKATTILGQRRPITLLCYSALVHEYVVPFSAVSRYATAATLSQQILHATKGHTIHGKRTPQQHRNGNTYL